VTGVRVGGDSITAVEWSGAIIAGPHTGKAPAPYTVGANGFFTFAADSVRGATGTVLADYYFVSLDDTYFRGGDHLVYFWSATDNGGGYSSDPVGLNAPPASIAEAQEATQGMLQASYIPTINWDPAYVARIQADANGDLEPTAEELANSTQKNCILLYNSAPSNRRRSGDTNRSSFMYALDRLGYQGHYDIYNHQGYGNTNNQLGGRMSIEQAQGYNLIVMDSGNLHRVTRFCPTASTWMPRRSIRLAGTAPGWRRRASARPSTPRCGSSARTWSRRRVASLVPVEPC
jgi:hypothetical protein